MVFICRDVPNRDIYHTNTVMKKKLLGEKKWVQRSAKIKISP